MDTLAFQTPSTTAPPRLGTDAAQPPVTTSRPTLAQRLSQFFAIDLDLDGVALCDGDSLHADLVDLFERGDAPTARPARA